MKKRRRSWRKANQKEVKGDQKDEEGGEVGEDDKGRGEKEEKKKKRGLGRKHVKMVQKYGPPDIIF